MRRLLSIALVLAPLPTMRAHDPVTTKLTWTQEISRIVQNRCASCRSARSAISLQTYEDARPWAKAIKDEVLNRRMPPWGAVKGFAELRDDPSLTQSEINYIAEWVEGGSPEGEPAFLPKPVRTTTAAPPKGRRVRWLKGTHTLLGIRPIESVPSTQVVAHLPDGSMVPLLWLQSYKREWNRTFVFREPIVIPEGARIVATPAFPLEFLVR